MTTQIANVSRLYGSVAELHLAAAISPSERVHGKITGVDSVGVSIVDVTDGGPRGAEQFFPWTSIGRIVVL